jgi:hypothetical protein
MLFGHLGRCRKDYVFRVRSDYTLERTQRTTKNRRQKRQKKKNHQWGGIGIFPFSSFPPSSFHYFTSRELGTIECRVCYSALANFFCSLNLSLSHTHIHTHSLSLFSMSLLIGLLVSFPAPSNGVCVCSLKMITSFARLSRHPQTPRFFSG